MPTIRHGLRRCPVLRTPTTPTPRSAVRRQMKTLQPLDAAASPGLPPGSVRGSGQVSKRRGANAMSLLFSYVDAEHEHLPAGASLKRLPGLRASASHAVAPVRCDHERGVKTLVDTSVPPDDGPARDRGRADLPLTSPHRSTLCYGQWLRPGCRSASRRSMDVLLSASDGLHRRDRARDAVPLRAGLGGAADRLLAALYGSTERRVSGWITGSSVAVSAERLH
jgi:hypothetical protein